MDWENLFNRLGETAVALAGHTKFLALIKSPRPAAFAELQRTVKTLSVPQMCEYEQQFLKNSGGVFDAVQRIRIMELYAALKMLQLAEYGRPAPFFGTEDALE